MMNDDDDVWAGTFHFSAHVGDSYIQDNWQRGKITGRISRIGGYFENSFWFGVRAQDGGHLFAGCSKYRATGQVEWVKGPTRRI